MTATAPVLARLGHSVLMICCGQENPKRQRGAARLGSKTAFIGVGGMGSCLACN
jgi:hypothetical protein